MITILTLTHQLKKTKKKPERYKHTKSFTTNADARLSAAQWE